MSKQNNIRKYPDANRQPRHKAAERAGKAQARQEVYNELSLEEKIARLPPEPHSMKQRARLMSLLEKKNQSKHEAGLGKGDVFFVGAETGQKQNKSKKYMKGN